MSIVPSPAQVRAQVAAVLRKPSMSPVIGIRVPDSVDLGDSLEVDGRAVACARCHSPLEIRERLVAASAGEPLVLLTSLRESDLGADVVARLAKRHLFSIEPWALVKERFQARHIDPRLVQQHPWVARALLDAEPARGFAPAPSGFLEAELVWRVLFEALLGLPGGERDPQALLRWSATGEAASRRAGIAEEGLHGLAEAVSASAGALARRIFDCALGTHGDRAIAVGLVARVLYGDTASGDDTAIKATGKLEAWLSEGELPAGLALDWADAAESLVRRQLIAGGLETVRPWLDAADALLDQLGARSAAARSNVLQSGFEQRLARFAEALEAFVQGRAKRVPTTLSDAARAVLGHELAGYDQQAKRAVRVEMALRLARWIAEGRATPTPKAAAFSEAAARYRAEGGHVDWARAGIWEGDPLKPLASAYGALSQEARRLREEENERFAELLANWSKTGSHDQSVIPVEHVLARVVGPVAAARPVLLIVVDGMGMAVFRELEADLVRQGWSQLDKADASVQCPVIAALPSVTEVSRASLLSGVLATGPSANEKKAFAAHAALMEVSERKRPPVLFHKGELTESGEVGVPAAIFDIVDDLHQRVLGVVINAVDDHLAKGDQLRVAWRVHTIRPLEELLGAARAAGRAVVIVSDHGHVPEHDTTSVGQADGERWRQANSAPGEHEVQLEGSRVMLGGGRIVAPWSETVRLGMKKNGYHGGAAPQEVVIPLGIYVPDGEEMDGWQEVVPESPSWWTEVLDEPVPLTTRPKAPQPVAPKKPNEQGQLFSPDADEGAAAEAGDAGARWIEQLLVSELMTAQRRAASRTRLSDERIRDVLIALDTHGGKLTRAALAKRLGMPAMRVGGVVSALRRVLNVDGYDVLSVEESSDTVTLSRALLETQFDLE